MPKFQFKAYNAAGRIEAGEIEARSHDEALSHLNARQLLPFETSEAAPPTRLQSPIRLSRQANALSPREYATFMRELAVLLQAELPVDQCLKLLAGQQRSEPMRRFSATVLSSVVAGASLSSALEKHATGAPPVVANLIKAGEARGNLAATLTDISRYLETSLLLRAKIQSALTYPLVLAVVALATIGIIVAGLVPTLMPLFKDNGAQPPVMLKVADTLTAFLSRHWVACLAIVVAIAAGIRIAWQSPPLRQAFQRTLLRMPFFGPLIRDTNTAVLARTLGTLLRNGVPLVAALQVSANALSNAEIAQAVVSATEDVKAGSTLARALRAKGVFSDMSLRFIEVGEEASRLDQMLLHLADMTETETQRRIDHGMTILGPALTIVIGAVVGTLVLSVMQAVMSVNTLVLR